MFRRVPQHHPEVRRPKWSVLAKNWFSCPSLLSLLPQPLRDCLCLLTYVCDNPSSCHSSDAKYAEGSPQWLSSKAPTANLHREVPGLPPLLSALVHQRLVLGLLSLVCFFHSLFPWHCQLQKNNLFCHSWQQQDFVLAISAGNFSCFFKSTRRPQSLAVVRSPVDLRLFVTEPPAFTKLINVGFVWAGSFFFLAASNLLQSRSGSCHVATYIFRPSMLFCTNTGYAQGLLACHKACS